MEEDESLIDKTWLSVDGARWRVMSRFSPRMFTVMESHPRSAKPVGFVRMDPIDIRRFIAASDRRLAAAAEGIILQGSTAPTWQQMVADDYETLNGGSP